MKKDAASSPRTSRRLRLPSTKTQRQAAYSLAAGAAAFGLTSSADAAIQYSGVQNLDIAQGTATNLDIDGNTTGDVLLKNYIFTGGNYQGATVNFFPGQLVGFNSGLNYVSCAELRSHHR